MCHGYLHTPAYNTCKPTCIYVLSGASLGPSNLLIRGVQVRPYYYLLLFFALFSPESALAQFVPVVATIAPNNSKEAEPWRMEISRRIATELFRSQPEMAPIMRRHRITETKVLIRFVISSGGKFKFVRVSSSPGSSEFNAALEAVVKRAGPFSIPHPRNKRDIALTQEMNFHCR